MIFCTKRRLFIKWLDERANRYGTPVINREEGIPRKDFEEFFNEKSGLKKKLFLFNWRSRWGTEDFSRLLDGSLRDGYIFEPSPEKFKITLKGWRFISWYWPFFWLGENFASVTALLLVIATIFIAIYTHQQADILKEQIQNSTSQESATFMIDFNNQLRNGPSSYSKIIHALDSNQPILYGQKAQFTSETVDDYLMMWELVGNMMQNHVIASNMAYDAFSYDVENAYCNPDIKKYIQTAQAENGGPSGGLYASFDNLARGFLQIDNNQPCSADYIVTQDY
jgi:hypothetical protein